MMSRGVVHHGVPDMAHLWVAVSLSVDFVCEVAELLIECDSSSTICPIEECGHNSSAQ